MVYFLFGISLTLSYFFTIDRPVAYIPLFGLLLIVASNYYHSSTGYFEDIREDYTAENSYQLQVAEYVKRAALPDESLVVFGNDWSSTIAYFSERKTFTVPPWFKDYSGALSEPRKYIGDTQIGAVVVCNHLDLYAEAKAIANWAESQKPDWIVGHSEFCQVYVPPARASQ